MSASRASFLSSSSSGPGSTGDRWLALAVGNSRNLWGLGVGSEVIDWIRLERGRVPQLVLERQKLGWELWVASVGGEIASTVREAIADYRVKTLGLADVPLGGLYETLGLDRALAVLGAYQRLRKAALVVDGGTALTLSAVDGAGLWAGGAILPGLRLQGRALHWQTAALPEVDPVMGLAPGGVGTEESGEWWLPERWADGTVAAIESGIVYGAIATVRDFAASWRERFPEGAIIFTGGDGECLHQWCGVEGSEYDAALVLKGMAYCRG